MDVIEKAVFCKYLNREVNIRYNVFNVNRASGEVVHKKVAYFDCKYKIFCFDAVRLSECPGFVEILTLEKEVNYP